MGKLSLYGVIVALIFSMGFMMGLDWNKKAQVAAENKQLKQNEVVISKDSQAAQANTVTLQRLDQITKETLNALPEPDNRCFDSNDVDELRKLWK